MSKNQKLIARLCKEPPPKDFKWDDLVTLMESAGFKVHCQGGSHHTFEYTDGFKVKVSKTHPQGILKKYQIDDVIEGLRRVGYLE